MMKTQEQPFQDLPAVEQSPMVERVVETTRSLAPERSPIFWPMVLSYTLSILGGFLTAYLVNKVFGTPYNQGLIQYESSLWRIGIPLSITVTFLLGVFLPILFARRRRGRIILMTLVLQFITLAALVIIGLHQFSSI